MAGMYSVVYLVMDYVPSGGGSCMIMIIMIIVAGVAAVMPRPYLDFKPTATYFHSDALPEKIAEPSLSKATPL